MQTDACPHFEDLFTCKVKPEGGEMRLTHYIDGVRFWSKKYRKRIMIRSRARFLTAMAITSSERQGQQVFATMKKFLKPSRSYRIQIHKIPSFLFTTE